MVVYNFSWVDRGNTEYLLEERLRYHLQEHVWFKGSCVTEVFHLTLDDDITRDISMESPLHLSRSFSTSEWSPHRREDTDSGSDWEFGKSKRFLNTQNPKLIKSHVYKLRFLQQFSFPSTTGVNILHTLHCTSCRVMSSQSSLLGEPRLQYETLVCGGP